MQLFTLIRLFTIQVQNFKKYNIGQSVPIRGNCWDNAPQESLFGHMKDEIDYIDFETFSELECLINNYMEYYNYFRYQWN